MDINNLKCLVFLKKNNTFNILKFKDKEIAKQYYKVANRKPNFKFVGDLQECINWCEKNRYSYKVIERTEYLISE